MNVKLLIVVFCTCALYGGSQSRKVKSKPENIEDTYGALVDTEDNAEEGPDVQNDDYDDYGGGEVPPDELAESGNSEAKVEFRSQSQVFDAAPGDTVRLPCEASESEYVTIWKKDAKMLYQAHIPMSNLENIREYANNTLEVKLLSDSDFGEYACTIMVKSENNPTLVHKIVKQTSPKIISLLPADNKTVYQVGESLSLTCNATGHPTPEISWYKGAAEGERLGIKGQTLTIPNLTFKHTGLYRCLADNKVGKAAHHHIEIFVEHKPVVNIEKYIVNSDKELDAELKCIVHAYPPPVVVWKREGVNINADPPRVTLKQIRGHVENILVIKDLKDEDFGAYTCSAKNRLDKVEKTVNLVKTPAIQDFIKPDKPNKDVVLTWKVESRAPISKHELQIRKKGEEEWQNIEPEVTGGENNVYTVKYTVKGLDTGNYETRLRSQNAHGWSDYSPIMPFEGVLAKHGSTHKNHKKHHHKDKEVKEKHITSTSDVTSAQSPELDHKESSLGASQVSGSGLTRSSSLLLNISLVIIFLRRH